MSDRRPSVPASDASGPYTRLNTLGEGLATQVRIQSSRRNAPQGGPAQSSSMLDTKSLVTGTSALYDENTVHPVVLRSKHTGLSPPRQGGDQEGPYQEHYDNLKRAQMRSLRAAVAREKHGGPGRSIKPRRDPPILMIQTEEEGGMYRPSPDSFRPPRPQSEPKSPRTNNGLLPRTREVQNGFFGASLNARRVGAAVQTDSKPPSAGGSEAGRTQGRAAGRVQFAQEEAAPAPAPPSAPPKAPKWAPAPKPEKEVVYTLERNEKHQLQLKETVVQPITLTNINFAAVKNAAPPVIDLDVSATWNRNSKLSKSLYKRSGTYGEEEEKKLGFASEYNDALRKLKDKLQSKGRENFMTFFDRYRPDPDSPLEVDSRALKNALKDMNLTFSDEVLGALSANMGVKPGSKINYRTLTDGLQWNKLDFLSAKVDQGRYRSLQAPDPAQPLGNGTVKSLPFATSMKDERIEGTAGEHLHKMQSRISALEEALKRSDSDKDGKVTYNEFFGALQEVSRKHRLHLGDGEILELFRDHDRLLESKIDLNALVSKAKSGSFPEFLRPRKERASANWWN